jgi:hypothetical protein
LFIENSRKKRCHQWVNRKQTSTYANNGMLSGV